MGRGPTELYHEPMDDAYVDGTLTCLKPSTIQNHISTEFPLVLNIEPTNACNLRCTYCPRDKAVLRQGTNYLSVELFRKIIDEACEYNQLIMLNLHKDGEPLMHKKLPEMVAYAKRKNVARTIHLNTNGTLLGTRVGRELLDAGIDDITVSVDAAFPETYHKLKKSRKFDALNRAVESFIEHRDKVGAETFIRVKIMEFAQVTDLEIKAFHDRWQGIADHVQVTGVHDWGGAIENLAITDESSPVRYPCALLWYALAVNSNGKVSICNVDWDYSGVVGDIYEKTLHEIWNDFRIRKIRWTHLNSRWAYAPVCDQCVVWVSAGDQKHFFESRPEFLEPVAQGLRKNERE